MSSCSDPLVRLILTVAHILALCLSKSRAAFARTQNVEAEIIRLRVSNTLTFEGLQGNRHSGFLLASTVGAGQIQLAGLPNRPHEHVKVENTNNPKAAQAPHQIPKPNT